MLPNDSKRSFLEALAVVHKNFEKIRFEFCFHINGLGDTWPFVKTKKNPFLSDPMLGPVLHAFRTLDQIERASRQVSNIYHYFV